MAPSDCLGIHWTAVVILHISMYACALKYTPSKNQMCAYNSVVIWPAGDGDDRMKTRSRRLLVVITELMSSTPYSTMSYVTFCHSSARPFSLSIFITRRARCILFSPLSPGTAGKIHAVGINLLGIPYIQLRHTHPAQIYCILGCKVKIHYMSHF